MPKILSGGYISWNYFVTNSRDLVNLDWVEIGEGNGIKPFDNTRSRGASNAPPPQSGNFSPNMRANGQQQQQINSQQQQPGFANPAAAYHSYYGIPSAQPLSANEGNFQKSPSGTSLNLSNNQRYPSGINAASNFQTGNMGGGGYSQQAPPQSTLAGLGLSQKNYVNQQQSSALYQNSNGMYQQSNSHIYPVRLNLPYVFVPNVFSILSF